jgi:hypothetical protein
MATPTGSATTTTTIKGVTRGPTSCSTINGGNYSNSFNNQPSIKDLVFGQARINESLNKKQVVIEKVLEKLNSTIESFTSAMNNQLSFNKMIETQLAQLAASYLLLHLVESWGNPSLPERMLVPYPPDRVSHLGGHMHLTMCRKMRWPQPNPRTKHPTCTITPRSRSQSTSLRGERRRKSRTPPLKLHRLHRHQKNK